MRGIGVGFESVGSEQQDRNALERRDDGDSVPAAILRNFSETSIGAGAKIGSLSKDFLWRDTGENALKS